MVNAATIFAPEISTLESQVAQFQAQITATQARITALGEADTVASGALQALQNAVAKISGLAPNAIATLKAAALNLFQGGDDSQGDDDGNQPIQPTPSPNGNGHSHKPDAILGKDIVEISSAELEKYLENQADTVAPELNGQFSELVCLLEDAPSTALTGQFVEIACPINDAPIEPPYIELVQLSQILAYQRLHNGEIPAAYIAFKSKTRAEAWGRWLVSQNNIASGFEVRAAKRILGFKWEIKLWGIIDERIQRLAKIDFNNAPSDQALNAWLETPPPVAVAVEEIPTRQHPTIDPTDVPLGVTLKSTDDDLLIEYIVWATVIARENGVPKPTQKMIGRLVLGNGIEAYRPRSGLCQIFTKTMDAVVHLIGGAGYRLADLLAAVEMRDTTEQEPLAPSVEVLPEVIDPQELSAIQIGSSVKIISPRHGEQLLGQVGTITAATPVGCVVVLGDLTRWFCTDEVQLAETPALVEVVDEDEDIEF